MPCERGVSADEGFSRGAMLTPDFTYYRKVFCEYFPRRCFLFYQEAIDYIKNIERSGSDYGLERMRELLALLGNPDDKLKFVHVAGTNGKGSVTAYLTSALKEAGYKVGTYNSPPFSATTKDGL